MNKYKTQPVTTGKKKATDGPTQRTAKVQVQQPPKQLQDFQPKNLQKPLKEQPPKKFSRTMTKKVYKKA